MAGNNDQGRKVAILGKAPSSALLAPFDDPSWEIWILNTTGYLHEVPRWDRQYELHDIELTKAPAYGEYYPWLKKQSHGSRPVVIRDERPEDWGPAAVKFPLDGILKTFGDLPRPGYLTNTVSLMIAHALYEHRQGQPLAELGCWGVDMAQHGLKTGHAGWFTSEYARQRPSCEYWLGIASGMGIPVTIPQQSDLLQSVCVYGHHHTPTMHKMDARRKELGQRIAEAQRMETIKHDEAVWNSGYLQALTDDTACEECRKQRQSLVSQLMEQEGQQHDTATFLAGAQEDTNYVSQHLYQA